MVARPLVWIVPGLWFALLATVARASVLFTMERLAHGSPLALVRHRLAVATTPALLEFLVLGVTAAFLVALAARRGAPRLGGILVTLLLATASWFLLAGWVGEDHSRRVGLWSTRGQLVAGALAAFALVLSATTCMSTVQRQAAPRGGARGLVLPVVLALALGPGARLGLAGFASSMPVRSVVARATQIPEAWRVVRAREDAPPYVGLLAPSLDYRVDGSDMPALLLPPPAEVLVRVPAGDGLALAARAGFDHVEMKRYEERYAGHAVRFTVAVPGRDALVVEVPFERVGIWPSTEWRDLGPGGVLPVPGGAEVRLRTAFVGPDGAEIEPPKPLAAGFGGLTFERRESVPRTRSSPERPNLILVLQDTQRADRLSAYGYERETSPHLDALAARGTLFEAAHSTASWTWPATASILTGRLPHEHGVLDEESCFLADELDTLAERLQRAGFTTAAFSANPLIGPHRNFHQGFELFDFAREGTRDSRIVVPPALEWLEAVAGTRFFLYLHLADPHAPLDPLPEGRALFAADVPADLSPDAINEHHDLLMDGKGHTETGERATEQAVPREVQGHVSDLYDACVWSGDYQLGRLVATLERLGLADETVIAFTSDHGEELYEHGFATHGQNVHGALVHVPLVLAGPGVPAGRRVATPVSNRHLAPSLARLAGADALGPEDGLDLLGVAEADAGPVLFTTEKGWWNGRSALSIHGLRAGELVLHWAPEGGPWGSEEADDGGQWRMYDLAADAGETRDVAAERPADAERLRAGLAERIEELSRRRAAPAIGAGEATLEMLRAIGYLEEEEEE